MRLRRVNAHGDRFTEWVRVALHRGREVFEGDIDVTPRRWFDIHMFGLSIRQGAGKWPNGRIRYVTERSIEPQVEAAIAHWMDKTPLRFAKGTGDGNYLSFENRGRCRSAIGRIGGPQLVELDAACTVGTVAHEIGHAIGLWHEHSRSDRGEHIRILSQNIQDGQAHQFAPHDGSAVNRGAYDLNSLMHYPSSAYSRNGQPTIVTLDGNPLPPRSGLSPGDIAAVRELYPELAWP